MIWFILVLSTEIINAEHVEIMRPICCYRLMKNMPINPMSSLNTALAYSHNHLIHSCKIYSRRCKHCYGRTGCREKRSFGGTSYIATASGHDGVIKWKHFLRYWPFVRRIHRSLLNSPHRGQWRGALMLSLICAWINGWVNNREAGDMRRHRVHYDVTLMSYT